MEKNFYKPDQKLLPGVMALMAEEYSNQLSQKIKMAHKGRQENNRSVILTSNTWGYDKVGTIRKELNN